MNKQVTSNIYTCNFQFIHVAIWNSVNDKPWCGLQACYKTWLIQQTLNMNLTHMIVELERYEFWVLNEEEPAIQMRGGKTEDMPRRKMQSCPMPLQFWNIFFLISVPSNLSLCKPPLLSQGPLSMGFLVFHSSAYNQICVQRLPNPSKYPKLQK